MFIIDFDDTLFNTYAHKQAKLKAVGKLGVSPELFWNTYSRARNNQDGYFTYSDRNHAEILGSLGFEEEKILELFASITKNIKDYLLPDAEFFLTTLKSFGQPMILLSLGDPNYQELKVRGTGVDKFFDRMFMVDRSKEDVLRELIKNDVNLPVWFINDKVDETQQLLFGFRNLEPVLRMSESIPQEQYLKSGIPHFFTLKEILDYINKYDR